MLGSRHGAGKRESAAERRGGRMEPACSSEKSEIPRRLHSPERGWLPPPSCRLCSWRPSPFLTHVRRRRAARSVSWDLEVCAASRKPPVSGFFLPRVTTGLTVLFGSSPVSSSGLCDDHHPSVHPPALAEMLTRPPLLPSSEGPLAHPAINLQMGHFLLQREDDFFSEIFSF